ncbi:uncharacterized protein [Epargyreus clarus]|uniref:uncharacterized protein n=1 Tax=Epargyreus clarus TaxID=520877 RepID=UPI003C2CCF4F
MPSNVKLEVKREKIASAYASSMSTSFSNVRRKQLELAAAEAKAKIQLDLIEKKLEYDLAANDYESEIHAPHSIHSSRCRSNASRGHDCSSKSLVNEWMEQNEVQESPILQAAATATEAARIPTVYPIRAQAQGPPVDSILQLAHTLKDIMVTSSTQQEERLLTRLSTPRELPSFAGDYIEWLHFKSAYEESTRVCHFSDSENLWRLRRALKGEARETVTELLIGNTSPDVIMEALQLRYGNADIIIQHLISQVKKLSPLQNNYQHDIITFSIKISNCVATIHGLHKLDYLRSPELLAAILNKLPNILLSKYTDYAYTRMSSDMPKLQLLAAFLKREAEMVSVVGVSQLREFRKQPLSLETQPIKRFEDKPRLSGYNRPVFATATRAENPCKLCNFCKKSIHLLPDCRAFKRAMRRDRWRYVKTNNLCYCCLLDRHESSSCTAAVCNINNCGFPHHHLLHYNKPSATQTTSAAEREEEPSPSQHGQCGPSSTLGETVTHSLVPATQSTVLLKIVKVNLRGPKGIVSTYALLDDGASISMIDKGLVQELGLTSSQSSSIKFIDAFGVEVFQSDAPKICTNISGFYENQCYDVTLRQVVKLNLPKHNLSPINDIKCGHLLPIKDIVCKECIVPRLLIGEDNYFLIAPLQIRHGNKQEPYATRCRLGWCIHGCLGLTHSSVNAHTFHLAHSEVHEHSTVINELNDLIKKSFELDSIGVSNLRRENTAHLRAVRILDETARQIGKQWEVGLPFVKDEFCMPDTYDYARSRLTGIMKKIQADSSYGERYRKEVRKLFDQGYARELDESELSASHIWYLAHFGVMNPNKPEKLSRLLQLSPYIDELGILRVDSRIDKVAGVNHQARRPTILDGQHRTNLRGADTEMRRSIAEINTVSVREAGAVRGVDWRFIPPGAPEMGGSWERMIRTVKSSLKVILKERAPHPDTLSTLLAEVEALVNSRPITHVSSDPYYPEALTPNHFLIGTSTSPQFGSGDRINST